MAKQKGSQLIQRKDKSRLDKKIDNCFAFTGFTWTIIPSSLSPKSPCMLVKPEVLAEVTEQPRFLPWVFDSRARQKKETCLHFKICPVLANNLT